MNKAYYDYEDIGIKRSNEWLALISPSYDQGYDHLMSHLHKAYEGGNIRAVRLAMELSHSLGRVQESWVIEGAIDWFKLSTRQQLSHSKMQTAAKRMKRQVERWNALHLMAESNLKDQEKYEAAAELLNAYGLGCSKSTMNKDYYTVENALKTTDGRKKYILASIPSPHKLKRLSEFMTKDW